MVTKHLFERFRFEKEAALAACRAMGYKTNGVQYTYVENLDETVGDLWAGLISFHCFACELKITLNIVNSVLKSLLTG